MGMAKRKYSKRSKIEPAVLTVPFILPDGAATSTIDLSQVASLINRRFYRQGINWAVAGFKVISPGNATGSLSIAQVPNTWVTSNAWEKAFRAWNKQQMQAVDDSGSQSAVAKFRDFKVFADVTHVTAGVAGNLLPIDFAGAAYATGEWEASQIVIPHGTGVGGTTVERSLHMVGSNFNGSDSRGVIEGYADSRAYPQSPDPVSPEIDNNNNWLAKMFDDGETFSDVLENATDRNDNLPYPQVNYPGGETQAPTLQYHDSAIISATTIGGVTTMKGGNFPCGLIRVSSVIDTEGTILQVNLVPGNHRGYLCEPMTEM